MSNTTPDWNKNEFLGYLFLYCSNADYVERDEERQFIQSKIDKEVYKKMRIEFDHDKDYQRIQKIVDTVEKHYSSEDEKEGLIAEIKDLFLSDGKFDILEINIYRGLKRLFSN